MAGNIKIGGSFPGAASGGGSGTVTKVTTQGGPFLASGSFTTAGTIANSTTSLTANAILLGAGTAAVAPLGSLGTSTTLLHGAAAGPPTFGPVSLSADVTGLLPFANIATLAATSLFGNGAVTGATGGNIAIGAGVTLSTSGTLTAGGSGGTMTQVIAAAGPFLTNTTITAAGTISSSTSTLTNHGVLIGQATAAPVAAAAMTDGQMLLGVTGADPAPATMSGDATITKAGVITVTKVGGVAPATVAGMGLAINNGTITSHAQITVAATVGTNNITLAATTTNVLINGPAAGGACTLTLTGAVSIDQRIVTNISQGATAATWIFSTGFNFGTTVPSPTITAVAGKRDTMFLINNVGTVFDFEAINQGFSP